MSMDFWPTDEQEALRDSIIRFARQELNEHVTERSRSGEFPRDSWRKCAEMQIMALPFPPEHGGADADFLTTTLSLNALGYACRDAGLVHAVTTQILCGIQILLFGSDEQKTRYLPPLCSGDEIFAQAISEPGSGSDAMAMRTRAVRNGDEFVLNGTKTFISNGPICDVAIVFAVTNPDVKALGGISCFIVEKDTAGFQRCPALEKMGLSTLQNGEFAIEDCSLPPSRLLGKEGQGAIIFHESMEWERTLLPAVHLGTLRRIVETSVQYARERQAFDQPIGRFQSVSNKVAEMKANLELGTLMVHKAAKLKDLRRRATLESSVCKLFVSESLKKACLDAIQIHGGYGYMTEYEIERDLRDSIASTIYSGTSELQMNIISKMAGL
jgi:alkylation response protein AidB-like acyl-CoA dehydrogenase